jgi:chloramphenicol-sensitive protein RarD
LGTIFLRERLRAVQVAAFLLAGAGVANLLIQQHTVPWIAILLSVTFGFYGLIRKIATLESLPGLVAETAVLTLPAGGFLLYLAANGSGAAGHCGMRTDALLIGAGLVTSTPLLLFAYGARRISMAAMGIIQYVSPTGALLLAVLVYGEPFDAARKTTFALIWVALAIYSIHAIITSRRSQAAEPVTTPDCDSLALTFHHEDTKTRKGRRIPTTTAQDLCTIAPSSCILCAHVARSSPQPPRRLA